MRKTVVAAASDGVPEQLGLSGLGSGVSSDSGASAEPGGNGEVGAEEQAVAQKTPARKPPDEVAIGEIEGVKKQVWMPRRRAFSYSQLRLFLMCSWKYFLRYIEGYKALMKNSELALGSSMHAAFEVDYRAKIKTGVNEPLSVKQDVFVDRFRKEMKDGVILAAGESVETLEEVGLVLVMKHHREIALNTHPVAVEKYVRMRVPGVEVDVEGYVDLEEMLDPDSGRADCITDHKSSSKEYPPDMATMDTQILLYATHEGIRNTRFDVLVKNPSSPQDSYIQRVSGVATPVAKALTQSIVRQAWFAIRAGAFLKQTPGKFPCRPEFCEYWNICMGRYFTDSRNEVVVADADGNTVD